jgi:hypothetical protein
MQIWQSCRKNAVMWQIGNDLGFDPKPIIPIARAKQPAAGEKSALPLPTDQYLKAR